MSVAMIALFVALSGTAFAATKLSNNSVTTKTIKNKAVTDAKIRNSAVNSAKIKNRSILGRDVRNDTLTGAQINESSLGQVPDAAKVGGIAPADLVTKSSNVQWNVPMNRGDAPRTLATFGPFTITGRCEIAATNTSANFDITTSANDTYVSGDSDFDIGETQNWGSYTNVAPNTRSYTSSEPYFYDPASGHFARISSIRLDDR